MLAIGETWTPEFRIAGYGGESEAGLVTGFVSGNTRVAKFDRGVLKAIAKGTAKITCKTYNGKSVSFVLTVVAAGS